MPVFMPEDDMSVTIQRLFKRAVGNHGRLLAARRGDSRPIGSDHRATGEYRKTSSEAGSLEFAELESEVRRISDSHRGE